MCEPQVPAGGLAEMLLREFLMEPVRMLSKEGSKIPLNVYQFTHNFFLHSFLTSQDFRVFFTNL